MFDWLTDFIGQAGYLGIAFLMFAETVFPPIPSEIIMSLAGLKASQGEFSLAGAIAAGTAGAMFGNVFWYLLARTLGYDRFYAFTVRHGRWIAIYPDELVRARAWFDRHGGAVVGFGRIMPTIRSLVSVPAGVLKMSFSRFVLFSTLGTATWTAFLAVAGYLLGSRYGAVDDWVGPIANAIIVVLASFYVFRVATYKPRSA